jgi:hypothetical protein
MKTKYKNLKIFYELLPHFPLRVIEKKVSDLIKYLKTSTPIQATSYVTCIRGICLASFRYETSVITDVTQGLP